MNIGEPVRKIIAKPEKEPVPQWVAPWEPIAVPQEEPHDVPAKVEP
jgi:hypothetical protein